MIALALGALACAGCSTPQTASGSLQQGKQRVVQLVLQAAKALPATSTYQPPTEVGTQPCRKTFAGYVVGSTGTNHAQVPLVVRTPPNEPASHLLGRIARVWTAAGYRLDRSRAGESQYPQIRAHAPAGYDVVATAVYNAPQINLYAVSGCLRGN